MTAASKQNKLAIRELNRANARALPDDEANFVNCVEVFLLLSFGKTFSSGVREKLALSYKGLRSGLEFEREGKVLIWSNCSPSSCNQNKNPARTSVGTFVNTRHLYT